MNGQTSLFPMDRIGEFGKLITFLIVILITISHVVRYSVCWYYGLPMVYESVRIAPFVPITITLFFIGLRFLQEIKMNRLSESKDALLKKIVDLNTRDIDVDKLVYIRKQQLGGYYQLIPLKSRWFTKKSKIYKELIVEAKKRNILTAAKQLEVVDNYETKNLVMRIWIWACLFFIACRFIPFYHDFLYEGEEISFALPFLLLLLILILMSVTPLYIRAYDIFKEDVNHVLNALNDDNPESAVKETVKAYRESNPVKKFAFALLPIGCIALFCTSIMLFQTVLLASIQGYDICEYGNKSISTHPQKYAIVLTGDDFYITEPVVIKDDILIINRKKYMFLEKNGVEVEHMTFKAVHLVTE